MTEKMMAVLALNNRQKQVIALLKIHGKIPNPEYQEVTKAIKKTAARDFSSLKEKGIVKQVGSRGPGVHYVLLKKGDIIGTSA